MKQILISILLPFCLSGLKAQSLHSFVVDSTHFLSFTDTTLYVEYGDSLKLINKTGETRGFNLWVNDTNYSNPPSYGTNFNGTPDGESFLNVEFPNDSVCHWRASDWSATSVEFNPPHQNITIMSDNGAFSRRFFFVYPETNSIHESSTFLSNPIAIYPSPVIEKLNVKGIPSNKIDYSIFNLSGKSILTGKISNNDNRIDIHDLPEGTYILHLTFSGVMRTFKFIKI
ncbi:MAG: T9SS type A sorting domain-containing protein [Bacteroidota bacterium]